MKINNELMDYVIEDIKTLIENEMEEHPNKFPYTIAFNKIWECYKNKIFREFTIRKLTINYSRRNFNEYA